MAYMLGVSFQSTHPQGVRRPEWAIGSHSGPFQSTHPQGVRPRVNGYEVIVQGFQSTHPQGVRPDFPGRWSFTFRRFNPRTRRGCDPFIHASKVTLLVFQSTHPQGVRLVCKKLRRLQEHVSIHAPAGGATPLGSVAMSFSVVSIHAPAGGATVLQVQGVVA